MSHETRGTIFDIQRFSVHDGNGIRTIVFLKGCMLRCKWCCNPESQQRDIETMIVEGKAKTIGRDVSVAEVLDTVERDMAYYRRSGGGLTLSGGESLCQPEFARALLKAAKVKGITTAMESMGGAPYEVIEMLLPYLDNYLLDIKHTDGEKHKEFTGMDNSVILDNAKRIALSGKTLLTIRTPVIPSFNHKEKEILSIARFAESLRGVKKIHLLPYHRLGQDKYEWLGRAYEMKDVVPPTQQYMCDLKRMVETETRLSCQIGG